MFDSTVKRKKAVFSPKRKVTTYEIEYFNDDYSYTVIDGEKYNYQKNCVIIAKPGQTRNSKLHLKCSFIHLELNDDFLQKELNALPSHILLSSPTQCAQSFSELAKLSVLKSPNELELLSVIYKLVDTLKKNSNLHMTSAQKTGVSISVLNATNFIDENFTSNIQLSDIARSAGLSPVHFHRQFKKFYGITPQAYLHNRRIEHAKFLLLNTDKTITDIAFLCGFNSQTYFNSQFKKSEGVSPLRYRVAYTSKF